MPMTDLKPGSHLFQLILDHVGEGVYCANFQGNAAFVNPYGSRLLGWDARDLLDRSVARAG